MCLAANKGDVSSCHCVVSFVQTLFILPHNTLEETEQRSNSGTMTQCNAPRSPPAFQAGCGLSAPDERLISVRGQAALGATPPGRAQLCVLRRPG